MIIKQYNDEALAHYSYAIISEGKMALVDPSRDPSPYYQLAEEHNAKIVAVFETHPHADFVSSHLQIHKETGATIYVSKMVGADYPHTSFDEGDEFQLGKVSIKGIHTPGHSPDGITFYAKDESSGDQAMFTGDTLFIGDVGRPDLREKAGNMTAKRKELAEMMYHTIQNKFNGYDDEVLVYPAHGAGSLCGKNMSDAASSTLGNERTGNWAFLAKSKEDFVKEILSDQPFIPSYFGYNVEINKRGAQNYELAKAKVPTQLNVKSVEKDYLVVDARDEAEFKKGHLPGSINIMGRSQQDKIETWLGAIVQPEEKFYLVVGSYADRNRLLSRIAKIGYESQILSVVVLAKNAEVKKQEKLNLEDFKSNQEKYSIIDIRNIPEHNNDPKFEAAINHPLNELRETAKNIDTTKPVVVHCAGGYRSAAGTSIIQSIIGNDTDVYDLSTAIEEF